MRRQDETQINTETTAAQGARLEAAKAGTTGPDRLQPDEGSVIPSSVSEKLTPRERLVLAQLIKGASSKQAANELGVSPRTIEFHRTNLMRKMGARNVANLIAKVLRSES